jgi:hypothetical protein
MLVADIKFSQVSNGSRPARAIQVFKLYVSNAAAAAVGQK